MGGHYRHQQILEDILWPKDDKFIDLRIDKHLGMEMSYVIFHHHCGGMVLPNNFLRYLKLSFIVYVRFGQLGLGKLDKLFHMIFLCYDFPPSVWCGTANTCFGQESFKDFYWGLHKTRIMHFSVALYITIRETFFSLSLSSKQTTAFNSR